MATISQGAIDLIVYSEVSSAAYYTKKLQRPAWPGGSSGVTIGVGYDLGQQTEAAVKAAWGSQVDATVLGRLQHACGIHGEEAKALTADMQDILIPWEQAYAVFTGSTLPAYIAMTEQALPNTGLLSPDSLGALVSLVYNRGAGGFSSANDRYREMRAIKQDMADQDFAGIPAEFRAMKRLWSGNPAMSGLVARRENEAVLFEKGLQPIT